MYLLDDVLANMANFHAQVLSCRLAAYRELLAAHDWLFEFSDDQRVWERGRLQRRDLNLMRAELDEQSAVWNALAPEGFKR